LAVIKSLKLIASLMAAFSLVLEIVARRTMQCSFRDRRVVPLQKRATTNTTLHCQLLVATRAHEQRPRRRRLLRPRPPHRVLLCSVRISRLIVMILHLSIFL
jgi:hypothetical protein